MPGCVDEVELIGPAIGSRVVERDALGFDRDAPLTLKIHRIEHLRVGMPRIVMRGPLNQAVR